MKPHPKLPPQPCPCGSKRTLQACCLPLLDGAPAPTAEALMRSRYTAYALKRMDYLSRSWHPSTRPTQLDAEGPRWTRLEIRRTEAGGAGDTQGVVEFIAYFRQRGRAGALHETSRFLREDGEWFYLDGEIHSGSD
jgi:SEC-C motif-containing protein